MPEDPESGKERSKKTHFIVSWAAIGLGVTMVMIGGILLLWGLSFQASVGEPVDLEADPLTGGPFLIPAGVMSLAFGILWIHYGMKGFKKKEEELKTKRCPNCGKVIEEDLNFCYHCTTTFSDAGKIGEDEGEDDQPDHEEPLLKDLEEKDDEPTRGQVMRARRQEERRRKKMEEKEGNKADSLDMSSGPLEGR